jgi:hypothetical protein
MKVAQNNGHIFNFTCPGKSTFQILEESLPGRVPPTASMK